jgi:AcrR family transcriptional regulator
MSTPQEPLSLRERNKLRTRELISDVATRLFLDRGFGETTIADVAKAAGVAKMTVTNHFPRKEDLVLDIHDEMVAEPARVVAERAPGQAAVTALRDHFFQALDRHDPTLGFSSPGFAALLLDSPPLMARLREIHEEREDALAETLAAETRASQDDLTPRLAAAQLLTIHRVTVNDVLRRTRTCQDHAATAHAIASPAHHAFGLLHSSMWAYAVR